MPRLRSLLLALATLAVPSTTLAAPPAPLGADPVLAGGFYSTGGGLSVALELRPAGGKTAICGVWAESEVLAGHLKGKSRELLVTGTVHVDGQRIRRGLTFLKQVPPAASYIGAPVECVTTTHPWRPGLRPVVRIPGKQVVMVRNNGSGAADIRFRPVSGINPALEKGTFLPRNWKHFPSSGADHGADRPLR